MSIFGRMSYTVETYEGDNATGETFAAPATVDGWVNDQTHLVRAKAEEVVSQSIVYAPISSAALFVPESKVTLPGGRVARVITVNTNDGGGLPLPEHVEVHLT